ncbi:MAG: RNA polymerase sigma factor [Anaerolineae bacterium]|nr:RNA polymerase sigma factor [Anaerolineae bacterium]
MNKATEDNDQIFELLSAAQGGSEAAFEAIYHRYVGVLFRLAYGLLLNEQDAEEVVQDSFAYAFQNLEKFDPTRSAFKTWLYTITISRCRNKRRRKWLPTIQFSEVEEWFTNTEHSPEKALEKAGIRETVLEALKQLSPKLREAVVLRYFEGLTYPEIGDVLNCSQKTASSRVRLAHEALYKTLENQREAFMEGAWHYE